MTSEQEPNKRKTSVMLEGAHPRAVGAACGRLAGRSCHPGFCLGGFSHGRNLNKFRGGRVAGFQSPGRGKSGKNEVRAIEGDNLRFKGKKWMWIQKSL